MDFALMSFALGDICFSLADLTRIQFREQFWLKAEITLEYGELSHLQMESVS